MLPLADWGPPMGEVKFYLVEGRMLLNSDRNPTWWKFRKYVRALKEDHALEKVLSELGSNHKVKRHHIIVERIVEVSPEEIEDRRIRMLAEVKRWVRT